MYANICVYVNQHRDPATPWRAGWYAYINDL